MNGELGKDNVSFVFVDEKIIKEVGAKKNGSCIYKVGRQAGSEVSTFSCS